MHKLLKTLPLIVGLSMSGLPAYLGLESSQAQAQMGGMGGDGAPKRNLKGKGPKAGVKAPTRSGTPGRSSSGLRGSSGGSRTGGAVSGGTMLRGKK
ncbi:MAG: hypothetical protein ACKV0T_20210 [Planctomycetales bacterium]